MTLTQDELNKVLHNRLTTNLNESAIELNYLKFSIRRLYKKTFDEINVVRDRYGDFDELNLITDANYILYQNDPELRRIKLRFKQELNKLIEAYVAQLKETLSVIRKNMIIEQLLLWDLGEIFIDDFEASYYETLEQYLDFSVLWQREFNHFTGKFEDKVKDDVKLNWQEDLDNLIFKINRTWTTAIADTTIKVNEAFIKEMEIKYVKWSDYVERNILRGTTSCVCKACKEMSTGGFLGLGIYLSTDNLQLLHPFCRCLVIPVVDKELIEKLNKLNSQGD